MGRRKMMVLGLLLCLVLAVWLAVFSLAQDSDSAASGTLPTRVTLPSFTPSRTVSPSHTPTPTVTSSPTVTATPTITATATQTPTLEIRVVEVVGIMPGVVILPTPSPFPLGTILLPAPPNPVEPLPNATFSAPPFMGWQRFESDHPLVVYSGRWETRLNEVASEGQYHRTDRVGSSVSFPFSGEGLRVHYVAAVNMGTFELLVDGSVIDTINAYSEQLHFRITRVYFVGEGNHVLTIRGWNQAVGLDAVDVYRAGANTLILPPPAHSPTPTEPAIPAAGIELIAAPATVQPTPSPIAPQELTITLVIAYDENGNRAVDPAEGVTDISVRVVEVGTNREVAQAFTDRQGYARLQIVTSSPVRVVVPYFSRVWDVRSGGEARFTLLLEPGTQPGLIP